MNRFTLVAGALGASAFSLPAVAQTLDVTLVASGLSRPVYATHAPDDFSRLFIVEQRGHNGDANRAAIRILDLNTGTLLATAFLEIDGVNTAGEEGLLGLAFHPDYENNGLFYVNFNDFAPGRSTIVREYRVLGDPATSNTADASSARDVLLFSQPQDNHNGGWMSFGPDGYLYIATGDGGNFNDVGPGHSAQGNSQDITDNLLGKMLRIDVDGPDDIPGNADDDEFPVDALRNYAVPPSNPFVGVAGDDEIWSYGLRNPWRCAFDTATGDLYIADVGQGAIEEVSFQAAASGGGENYGWRVMEGNNCFDNNQTAGAPPCNDPSLTAPFHTYTHSFGCSITGGEVYRGCAMPGLDGTYFFADFCSNTVWSLRYDGVSVSDFMDRTAEFGGLFNIAGFGLDAYGEMYVCSLGGTVSRIVPDAGINDCNSNGFDDACDIVAGTLTDFDGNQTPDQCEPAGCSPADVTTQGTGTGDPLFGIPDGQVTTSDLNFFVNFWVGSSLLADVTTTGAGMGDPGFGVPDGSVTTGDLNFFVNAWVADCP